MECPVCKCPLIVVERNKIELDYCVNCKGIWFDAGELRLLSQALNINLELPDIQALGKVESLEKPRSCPRCKKKMDKINLGEKNDILIDRCPKGDGLWFDWGELGQVLEQRSHSEFSEGRKLVNFLGETFKY